MPEPQIAVAFYGVYVTELDPDGRKRDLPQDLDQYADDEKEIHYLWRENGAVLFTGQPLAAINTESFDIDLDALEVTKEQKTKVYELVENMPDDVCNYMSGLDIHLLWGADKLGLPVPKSKKEGVST